MMTGHGWQLWPEFDCHTHFHEVWSVERQKQLACLKCPQTHFTTSEQPYYG